MVALLDDYIGFGLKNWALQFLVVWFEASKGDAVTRPASLSHMEREKRFPLLLAIIICF
jgi:hypothetical protein